MRFEVITLSEALVDWQELHHHRDIGQVNGVLRGYNVEVVDADGKIDYTSMVSTYDEPDSDNRDFEYVISASAANGYRTTGRVIFRGYFAEHYDPDDRETYLNLLSDQEFDIMAEGVGF